MLLAAGFDPAPADRVRVDPRGFDRAVAALVAADPRPGADALWARVAARTIALRHALLAVTGGRALHAGDELAARLLDPLRRLEGAPRTIRIAGRLGVQTPTPLHEELLTACLGGRTLEAFAAGDPRAARDELQAWGVPAQVRDDATQDGPPPPPAVPRALDGVRVVELGGLWAAPQAAQLLRERGAEVVKIEAPTRPDGLRAGAPRLYAALNAGKRVLELDLRTDGDRFAALLGPDTVVIENFTARVLGNLGFPPERILATGAALVRMPASRARPDDRALGSLVEFAGGLTLDNRCAPMPFTDALAGATAALHAVAALSTGDRLRTVAQIDDVAVPLR